MIIGLLLLALLGVAVGDHENCTNIAEGGRAIANNFIKPPKRAIDGNTAGKLYKGSMYTSRSTKNNMWMVRFAGGEIGLNYPIKMVTIWPRKDQDTEKISNAKVYVDKTLCGEVQYTKGSEYHQVDLMCPNGTEGSSVWVSQQNSKLELAEVQVWVSNDKMPTVPSYSNVALNKPAKQSRTYMGNAASRAVDGNTNKFYSGKSCSTTAAKMNRFWAVTLGETYEINNIVIHNRLDKGKSKSINGVKVYVRNGEDKQLCGTIEYSETDIPIYNLPCKLTGSKVIVTAPETSVLTLCEVEVYVVEEEEGTEVMDE